MNDRNKFNADEQKQIFIRPGTPLHSVLELIAKAIANKLVGEPDSEGKTRRSKFPRKTHQDT